MVLDGTLQRIPPPPNRMTRFAPLFAVAQVSSFPDRGFHFSGGPVTSGKVRGTSGKVSGALGNLGIALKSTARVVLGESLLGS